MSRDAESQRAPRAARSTDNVRRNAARPVGRLVLGPEQIGEQLAPGRPAGDRQVGQQRHRLASVDA